jgi:hypothetical protein
VKRPGLQRGRGGKKEDNLNWEGLAPPPGFASMAPSPSILKNTERNASGRPTRQSKEPAVRPDLPFQGGPIKQLPQGVGWIWRGWGLVWRGRMGCGTGGLGKYTVH